MRPQKDNTRHKEHRDKETEHRHEIAARQNTKAKPRSCEGGHREGPEFTPFTKDNDGRGEEELRSDQEHEK